MSMHKSLKSKSSLQRQRNVLTREERLDKLTKEGRHTDEDSIFGLPKVLVLKAKRRTKDKKVKTEEELALAAEEAAAAEGASEEDAKTEEKK